MNHLIIYTHISDNSFSYYLKEELVKQGETKGWNVQVRDLYALNFNPVLTAEDMQLLKSGETPEDIKIEQDFLTSADSVSVIFPLWWASFPAILKGYIDRVFTHGFAFKVGENGVEGLLKNKKVHLYTAMGNDIKAYEEKGLIDAFKKIQGEEIFEFAGMEIASHKFFSQVPQLDEQGKRELVDEALKVFQSESIEF